MCLICLNLWAASGQKAEETWRKPEIRIPAGAGHPRIACTRTELARLRRAWAEKQGAAHAAVAGIVRRADAALKTALEFPPRGGQHNQWYQCDTCQVALKTIDAHHHQCPICKKIYSGPPYDDVIFSQIHRRNLRHLYDCAWAYALTGKPEYAKFARKVLLGYADRYQKYPFHGNSKHNVIWNKLSGGHLFEQTLSEASVMATQIAPAYDLVIDSPVLSKADRSRIRDGLFLPMLKNIDHYKAGVSNWQSWHNAAMFRAGAVIDRPEWMQKAVYGEAHPSFMSNLISRAANLEAKKMNRVGNGFIFQMQHSVTADGMWFEGSWGYHFYTLSALVALAEAARRLDIDLWHYPGFLKMFTLPLQYAMPDGTLPRFGDDVRTTVRGRDKLFEPAFAALKAPVLLTALPNHATWYTVLYGRDPTVTAPPQTLKSVVFRGAGHAILRTDGAAGLVTAMTFGPYGGYHGHLDKLSFVFFGYGRELGVDPGRARSQAYRLPIHRNWYKATVSHNAVLVDGHSQKGVEGKLLWNAFTPRFAAVAAACDQAFPKVVDRRILVQSPEYLLVVDLLRSKTEHEYTWLYHNRGTGVRATVATRKLQKVEPGFSGTEYLQDLRSGRTNRPVTAEFTAKDVIVTLRMAAGKADTEVVTGTGVGGSVTDRVPVLLARRRGRDMLFATVLAPAPSGKKCPVSGIRCEGGAGGSLTAVIELRHGGRDTVRIESGCTGLIMKRNGKRVLRTASRPSAASSRVPEARGDGTR